VDEELAPLFGSQQRGAGGVEFSLGVDVRIPVGVDPCADR
jgi:hypothetical protein